MTPATLPLGLLAVLLLTAIVLSTPAPVAVAHDEAYSNLHHRQCREWATRPQLADDWRVRNAEFQRCLQSRMRPHNRQDLHRVDEERRHLYWDHRPAYDGQMRSALPCWHADRNEAFRAHDASHDIKAARQCRLAVELFCGQAKSRECQRQVSHRCARTENLCKQSGFLQVPAHRHRRNYE